MTPRLLVSSGYGRRVGLLVHPVAAPIVESVLPFWWTATAEVTTTPVGRDTGPEQTWTITTPERAERVVRDMELWVAEHAVDRVFVHAACVVHGDRALLLPGRSMVGKTTLTAALLRAGASYGSDEYAVLDAAGLVHPYPRPLSVREGTGRHHVAADAFGARIVTGAVPVHAIAVVRYVAGAIWDSTVLSPSEAVLRMLDNTVSARSRPAAALEAVSVAVEGAYAVESARDDADAAAAVLLGLIG